MKASPATTDTATTWNSTQQQTFAEYSAMYNMETIPESLNGELPPRPSGSSHGSRGHAYIPNLHVPKRSNTFSSSTSTSHYNHQRQAAAEPERPSSALSRSFSPLSPPSPSGSGSSRMIGGGKSTQRVKEWVIKRSNSTREHKSSKPTSRSSSSSSNSGHQTVEIIHLGGGRVDPDGQVHTSALSPTYTSSRSPTLLAPPSRARTSYANSIDSRVTQWSDLYHDGPESLTAITKPATATGKPPRPASPQLHERPQLMELGLGGVYNGGWGQREQEVQGEGHQSRHRHTKSDGSIHPAPLRLPSNSSSSSVGNQNDGAAVTAQPEETWMPQGLTRSDSKWKPLPVPPPPGAPGSITPLADGGRRAEDNFNMAGVIDFGTYSPYTSVESESEFGEREDTPTPRERYNQGVPHIVNVMVQNQSGSRTARDRPSPPPSASSSFSNDVSALGIGYGGVGLGVMSPPLTPPETKEAAAESAVSGGIRESMWPVPPSYSLSQSQPQSQFSTAPSRSATSPEKQQQQQHQHQQKQSTSPSMLTSTSPALASSPKSVPTLMIPKRSDSLSYSRSVRKPHHAPQALRTTASTSSLRSTEKSGYFSVTEQIAFSNTTTAATATKTAAVVTPTPPLQQHKFQSPTITPPTPIVQGSSSTSSKARTTPSSTPSTPTWRPRASLSSKEMLWLHRNYRGIAAFMTAWGLNKGLGDEAESKEGLSILRELMAAELAEVQEEAAPTATTTTPATTMTTATKDLNTVAATKVETSPRPGQVGDVWDSEDYEDAERVVSNGNSVGRNGGQAGKGQDNWDEESWLDFSPGPSPGEKPVNGRDLKENEAAGHQNGGYAALKGQAVRMKLSPKVGSPVGDSAASRYT